MTTSRVVLLHGVGLDRSVWGPVTEHLGLLDEHLDVHALDLPGHGDRPAVREGVTVGDLAGDVADRITGLGPEPVHLVGFSLGALVAQHLAVHRPELVATLTSVSSVCRRTEAERASVLERLATAERDPGASSRASLRRWFEGTEVPAEQVEHTREVLLSNDPDSFVRCYRVFATADAEVGPELGRIIVPSVAVTGADDPGSTPEMTHRLADAIPGCRAEVVPHTRHMLPLERPDALVAVLTTLIGEHARA